jgi:hypothetical protein
MWRVRPPCLPALPLPCLHCPACLSGPVPPLYACPGLPGLAPPSGLIPPYSRMQPPHSNVIHHAAVPACLLVCLSACLPGWLLPPAGNPLPAEDRANWGTILLNSVNTWSTAVITVLVFHPW